MQALGALLVGVLPALRFGAPAISFALAAFAAIALAAAIAPADGPHVRSRAAPVVVALVWAGFVLAGLALGGQARMGAFHDCRARLPDGVRVRVEGWFAANLTREAGSPTTPGESQPAPALPFRIRRLWSDGQLVPGCEGEVRTRFPAWLGEVVAGSSARLTGEWRASAAAPSHWPADPAWAGFLRADSVAVLAPPSLRSTPLLTLRGRAERHVRAVLPRHAALADALILGRRETLDPELADRFTRSGLVHLLAISGSHVGLLAMVLLGIARSLRLGPRPVALGTLGLLGLYLAVIGAPASAMRAGVFSALAVLGLALQRSGAPAAAFASAALLLVVVRPLGVLDAGLQLSFAGVLAVTATQRLVLRHLPGSWRAGLRRYAAELLALSAAAFLATAPVAAHHFGRVAPIAVLANLPAIPLTGLALVGILLSSLVHPLVPPLGQLFAEGTGAVLDLLSAVAHWAAEVPGGHHEVPPPQWPLWAAIGLAAALSWDVSRKLRRPVRAVVAAGTAAAAVLAWPLLAVPAASRELEIVFLDVGQGDAVAIRTPAGRWVLIDAGPRDGRWDAGARRVLPFLRANRAPGLAALVLTHPHADHIGGAPAVLDAIPVGRLVEPGLPSSSPFYLATLQAAERNRVPWMAARAGSILRLDGVEFRLLWPEPQMLDAVEDANQISAVTLVSFGSFRAILPGDAGAEVEAELVRRFGSGLRAQVLKAGHHGSESSSSGPWLDAVAPQLAVVSAGRRNLYGHPAPATLARFAARGVPVAGTDREGTIRVRARADGSWEWVQP